MGDAQPLTIVMYHYVRDLVRSRYPAIKGLPLDEFKGQLDYLKRNYTPVTAAAIVEALDGGEPLPKNAVWLTFDDGYLEHFTNCFPLLHDAGVEGAFFPAVAPIVDGVLLDVNRVHFMLAVSRIDILCDDLNNRLMAPRYGYSKQDIDRFHATWAKPNRFDDGKTIYFKRMLQTALPEQIRHEIAAEMFKQYLGLDEAAFAQELYASADQLKLMQASGMYIGCHGSSHRWMDSLGRDEQQEEINKSLDFLRSIRSPVDDFWICAYPYGAWNQPLLGVLDEMGCSAAVTTEPRISDLGRENRFLLPRLDTNDVPKG